MDALPLPWPANKLPYFSIVIPVFNRVAPLQRALESVFAQTFDNYEVIVVDDGSDDNVAKEISDLVQEYCDNRLNLIRHKHNRNGAAARNTGIRAVQGQFVCFLDSDDCWLPNKLEWVTNCIEASDNKTNFLIHHQYCNSRNGQQSAPLPKSAKNNAESVAHYSFVTNNVGGIQSSTICVPSQLAKQCLFNESFSGHQDWDFALKCGEKTQDFRFIPCSLTVRGKDSDDSVAEGLSWQYSLWFYTKMASYFNGEEVFYYLHRVVLKKAKNTVQIFPIIFNRLFIRSLWLKPRATLDALRSFNHQISQQKKRIQSVAVQCKGREAKTVMLWGANDYAKVLVLGLRKHVQVTKIIDSKASIQEQKLLGINIVPFVTITKVELDNIDAIVLATDRHQNSMKSELSAISPTLLNKVIEF